MIAKWHALDGPVRTQIKQLVLQGLGSGDVRSGTAAAQVVSAIAMIELPEGSWPELMDGLLANVTLSGKPVNLRRATLEAIGFICESIEPDVLVSCSSQILTAVINGLRKEEPTVSVRIAAAKALLNSVDFIKRHMENPSEAAMIMQTVCEATIVPDEKLGVVAFECLNEVVRIYYDQMGTYLNGGIAQMAIGVIAQSSSDQILLQAIEFWSTLAEIERDFVLPKEDDEAVTSSFYFCHRFSSNLLPPLLKLLLNQPGEDNSDDWCPSMAASTCIALLSEVLRDAIVGESTSSFIDQNIMNTTNWKFRDAAIMALGSILDGPSTEMIAPLIQKNMSRLIDLLANDSSVAVQDSAAWAIGRLCDFHLSAIPDGHINVVLQVLQHCLVYPPRVSVNCAWSLMTICTHLGAEDDSIPTSPVSPFFTAITESLLKTADRPDADDCNLRAAAYQSLAAVLLNSPADCIPLVTTFQRTILARLETTMEHFRTGIVNADDRNRLLELQSHLLTVLQATIKKCGEPDTVSADKAMQVALTILSTSSQQSGELEDVWLLIGGLASELSENFIRFTPHVIPFLLSTLSKWDDPILCGIAIGVVGDMARALGPLIQPHCNDFMQSLLACLSAGALDRSVKPHIISAIGDIALAINGAFVPYLDVTMNFLSGAAAIKPASLDDFDELDWISELRSSLLEALTCIIQGLKEEGAHSALVRHLPAILAFVKEASEDPERTDSMVRSMAGLLGDISDAYGSSVDLVHQPWLSTFFREPLPHQQPCSEQTLAVLNWAKQTITRSSS